MAIILPREQATNRLKEASAATVGCAGVVVGRGSASSGLAADVSDSAIAPRKLGNGLVARDLGVVIRRAMTVDMRLLQHPCPHLSTSAPQQTRSAGREHD
jgi:hypothetical protein